MTRKPIAELWQRFEAEALQGVSPNDRAFARSAFFAGATYLAGRLINTIGVLEASEVLATAQREIRDYIAEEANRSTELLQGTRS